MHTWWPAWKVEAVHWQEQQATKPQNLTKTAVRVRGLCIKEWVPPENVPALSLLSTRSSTARGAFAMGDPLSLAAGIVGLVSLTIQLLQVANKFKDDVKGVGKEVAALIEELNALNSVLEMLKKAWEHKRAPANIDLSALARIETTCEAQLNELLEKLRKNEVRLQKCVPYLHVPLS
jgi:hypothetical protein